MAPNPEEMPWRDLSFIGNFAAAADSFGPDQLGAAWGVAGLPFKSRQDRELLLAALVSIPRADVPPSQGP